MSAIKTMLPILEEVRRLTVSSVVSPHDRMMQSAVVNQQHYYYVGRSNLLTVLNVLSIRSSYRGGGDPVQDIFDFGCGYGRVARWFRAALPNSHLHVTDLDRSAVEFCVQNFGCLPATGPIPPASFDLVWLGSVFTHLPATAAALMIDHLLASLRPNGVIIFTSQGRYSIERMKGYDWANDSRAWMHYNLDRERFETLAQQYHQTGYGYVDYPGQKDYGVCVAQPTWYGQRILKSDAFLQILLQEKGSDNHQDVSAFMRAPLLDSSRGPLWHLASQVSAAK
jgi:SAM-dependent methyltransferase